MASTNNQPYHHHHHSGSLQHSLQYQQLPHQLAPTATTASPYPNLSNLNTLSKAVTASIFSNPSLSHNHAQHQHQHHQYQQQTFQQLPSAVLAAGSGSSSNISGHPHIFHHQSQLLSQQQQEQIYYSYITAMAAAAGLRQPDCGPSSVSQPTAATSAGVAAATGLSSSADAKSVVEASPLSGMLS